LLNGQQFLVITYENELITNEIDNTTSVFGLLRSDTTRYYFNEWEMNSLGCDLLYFADRRELALEAFRLNVLLFPGSFNAYDSYGEALSKAGRRQEAILMYEHSIRLNPENEGGKATLHRILGSTLIISIKKADNLYNNLTIKYIMI
jgi:tetratricopeptide (TPR) repeat protein